MFDRCVNMMQKLHTLDNTIEDIKKEISSEYSPFLVDVLQRLVVIRDNQQDVLIKKASVEDRSPIVRGFRGFGVS